ncbi:unnamed protein product [Symbiodinium sp. CCMP2592]|nr:unnamed protein product [Symbiodinium sp. CCMP2592]
METPTKRRRVELHNLERVSPPVKQDKPALPRQKPPNFGGHHSKAGQCQCCQAPRAKHQHGGYCAQCVNRCRQLYGHRSFSKLLPDQARDIAAFVDKHASVDKRVKPLRGNHAVAKLAELLPRLEAAIERIEKLELDSSCS